MPNIYKFEVKNFENFYQGLHVAVANFVQIQRLFLDEFDPNTAEYYDDEVPETDSQK